MSEWKTKPHFVRYRLITGILLFALACAPALAHRFNVFASTEGSRIVGSVYLAGGGKVRGTRVFIKDTKNRILAELTPDADGGFVYPARAAVDHLIVADSGDGHRAEWLIKASELVGGFPPLNQAAAPESDAGLGAGTDITTQHINKPAAPNPANTATKLNTTLESAIERAVARQIGPLREELRVAQDDTQLRDILGGIGYIFGLAGLVLWWHSRGSDKSR